jgi:hypothetical protein
MCTGRTGRGPGGVQQGGGKGGGRDRKYWPSTRVWRQVLDALALFPIKLSSTNSLVMSGSTVNGHENIRYPKALTTIHNALKTIYKALKTINNTLKSENSP